MQVLKEAARGLFGVCVAVAAMELAAGGGSMSRPFRSVCALGATLCALRIVVRLV